MKKIFFLFIIVFLNLSLFAQSPNSFKYQAVVRHADGTVLSEQAVGLQITILQGTVSGTTTYQETFSETTNSFGLVNLEIGTGGNQIGSFSEIDWTNGPFFIETAIDISGGTTYEVMGTSQLLSVPYALHANTVNPDNICDLFSYYYADIDGDNFGNQINVVFSCSPPEGYVSDNTDCDDSNFNVNPNADEICNGEDDNCNGEIDEGLTTYTFYADTDEDGFGDPDNSIVSCSQPVGYVLDDTDCDDDNPNINPGADEVCDGIDNNCYNGIDEDMISEPCENTNQYGTCVGMYECMGDEGWVCDADMPVEEMCNGVDDNCNGEIDEGYPDTDGDGEKDCLDEDDDNDGILDIDDNCPLISNLDQADLDLDGIGDACDPDIDDDGVLNDVDCDPFDQNINVSIGSFCSDGDACTVGDVIDENCNCVGTPIICDDNNICNGIEICDPSTGSCIAGTPINCDDGNPCTIDYCDPVLGCVHENSTEVCDDGDPCTTNDRCQGGFCMGDPIDCDDGNPCTVDYCDPVLGCVHEISIGDCDDGDPCTVGDYCNFGTCIPGEALDCDDGDPNTIDYCVDGVCQHDPAKK